MLEDNLKPRMEGGVLLFVLCAPPPAKEEKEQINERGHWLVVLSSCVMFYFKYVAVASLAAV